NVPAIADAAATSVATAATRAMPTFRIPITPLVQESPHAIQGRTLSHGGTAANPNNLGGFVPFITGVSLANGVDAATRSLSRTARAAERVRPRLRVHAARGA